MSLPRLIAGLSEIAPHHDALICDVWGVVHDGQRHHPAAADALRRFKECYGPVVLLTNAPRVPAEVAAQCTSYGLPPDCYDAIVSSGGAARDELARRSGGASAGATNEKGHCLPLYYIGPDRDLPMIHGLNVRQTSIAEAEVALAIGLRDDMVETPADYDEQLGGEAIYYGKPHRPIYESALAAAALAAKAANRQTPKRPLAVGDGLLTDIKGANGAGLEALFIADGVHGEEVGPYTGEHLAALFTRFGAKAGSVMRRLAW
jgi:ribonucleotide monophosphatase NagD (HAD superfamily)